MNYHRLASYAPLGAVLITVALALSLSACPEAPRAVPQAQQAAEAPGYPEIAGVKEPTIVLPTVAEREAQALAAIEARKAAAKAAAKSAPAPKAEASNAKAPAKKSAKAGKPPVTAERYAELQAEFYAEHATCIKAIVDHKIDGDIRAGQIRDFGNIRESGLCGYDYFDPATGRLPPYPY